MLLALVTFMLEVTQSINARDLIFEAASSLATVGLSAGATAFLTGLIFIRNLQKKLLSPLDEIQNVLVANLNGETKRHCAGANLPGDIRVIFGSINSLLDRCIHDDFKKL